MGIGSKRWPERLAAGGLLLGLLAATAPVPGLAADDAPATLALTLRPGDTLIGIGERYLEQPGRWVDLARLNRIRDPRRLRPGAALQIPLDWMRWQALPVEVVHVHGAVQGPGGPLAPGMRLSQGDRFDTGADGILTLRFAGGATAVFAPQTRAALGASREAPLGGVRATRIDLDQGAVETTVQPLATPESRFDVKTPRVVTAVRGTRFRVAQEPSASRHEVLEGRVAAQGAAPQPVEIGQGSGLRAEGGQLGAVVPLLPPPDLSAVPARIERTSQLLQVAPLPGAVAWRWQVATDGAFVQRLQDVQTREPRWLLAGLPDGDYQLRVRAADAQAIEGNDAQMTFAVRARPEAPLQLSPPAGASVVSGTALRWTQVAGAPAYRLQVARDAQFSDLVLDRSDLATGHLAPDPALAPGLYHWRLATQRPDGSHGPFGDASSFTVLEPSAVAPPQLGTDGLRLAWSGPAGFQHQVQVARSPDFAQPLLDRQVPGASLTLPDPAPGRYHVRTRLVLPDGSQGPWSSTQQFDVPAPPEPPSHPWYLLLLLLLPLLL
ncbi:MAG: FecR domain-containing protein, partial [Rhodoferax sp.]|nr:FecR domain-containing protein [Rhodoferax sp.]